MKTSTCIVTQSLSCSLVGLGEPVDCGVVACGGLWIKNKQTSELVRSGCGLEKQSSCSVIILQPNKQEQKK